MKVSVIVCTRNRAYAIEKCLNSLVRAFESAGPLEAEIVIVDNGSTDDTAATIDQWAKSSSFSVRSVMEPKKGLANARNCGIHQATGDLFVFTDDDCVMDQNYIKDCLNHVAHDTVPVMRGGRIELGDMTDLPITIKTESHAKRWSKDNNSVRHENLVDTIYGCNMVIPKKIIDTVGPFDSRLGAGTNLPSAEDTDYVFRAYLAGFTIEYVPDMIVYHFHGRKKKSETFQMFCNYCIGSGALYIKYFFKNPNFTRPFYWHLRIAFKELISGKNDYVPGTEFSHKDRIFNNLKGVLLFLYISLIQRKKSY